jgi:hypothetical protein
VRSTMTEEALKTPAGPTLLAKSTIEAEDKAKITVPSEQEDTVTVIEGPEAAEGVKRQPVAVPVFEKSDEAKPEMASEKV